MEVLFTGMLSGCATLRAVETLSEVYAARVPDTTLHDGWWSSMGSPCAKCWCEKSNTAIDGKSVSVSTQEVGDWSDRIGGGGEGSYRHRAWRALHVSNDTTLFLGQEIPSKRAETTEFRPFLEQLLADYGKTGLLEVISIDAGMVSQENADYVVDGGLDYIMELKGPQQVLFEKEQQWAQRESLPDKTTSESHSGKRVIREIHRLPVEGLYTWRHRREIWHVKQTTLDMKTAEETLEERFFLTSLAPQS
ncbi:MAG: transposase, partial [Pyrinomonadaceae bacterium]